MPGPLIDLTGMGGFFGAQDSLREYIARQAAQGQAERQAMLDNMQLQRQQRATDLAEQKQVFDERAWDEGAEGRTADVDYRRAATGELVGRPAAATLANERQIALQVMKDQAAQALEGTRYGNERNLKGYEHELGSKDASALFAHQLKLAGINNASDELQAGMRAANATGAVKKPPPSVALDLAQNESVIRDFDRMLDLDAKADPYMGPAAGRIMEVKALLPESMTGKLPDEFTEYRTLIAHAKNVILQARSGAAINEHEAERLLKEVPDVYDRGDLRRQKISQTRENLKYVNRLMRAQYGLDESDVPREPMSGGGGGRGGPVVPDVGPPAFVFDEATGELRPAGKGGR